MSTPTIRPYDPKRDFEGGLNVFFKTINPALDHEPTRTIGSYLWYIPYVTLSPTTCLVLSSSSTVVGYILGTPSTTSFSSLWSSTFAPTIDPSIVPPPSALSTSLDPSMETPDNKGFRSAVYNGDCSMLLPHPNLLTTYPAHLHIDILPSHQGQGWGRKLIEAWCEIVKGEGATGVHLDMVKDNDGARKFYERLGFEVCGEVLDGGKSGEKGVSGDGIVLTLVKKL